MHRIAVGDTMYIRIACGLLVSMALLGGCATPPKATNFEKSKTYSISKDMIWEKLISFFTSNNIQIKTIEKDSGVIYAERANADQSFADCGQPGLAAEMARPATLNVFVRTTGDKTEVTVNTQFTSIRIFDGRTMTAPCHSTGLLERQLLSSLDG